MNQKSGINLCRMKVLFQFDFLQCPIYLFDLVAFPDLNYKRFLLDWKVNCFPLALLTLDIHFALLNKGCSGINACFCSGSILEL